MMKSVSVSVAKTDVVGSPIERGSGIVKEKCIKENETGPNWVNRSE
jgi:hypothetical protein